MDWGATAHAVCIVGGTGKAVARIEARHDAAGCGVAFRWACNKHLRVAITCFADNSRHASDWAADIYGRARQRGCKHAHAIRILARAWVRVLWRALQDGEAYDPAKHKAAVRIA